ncbi:polysaccharide deacetylase family protein [Falsibacillus albus]|uniref:Polysaccharide deacetylase family protein n=1 Tax=Falsibacillus albus TaxID=2478915 RepID=A0A3L7JU85_9BACI|nr:polysaccharide deacetylase family protein [Falsibacillus albus]RLQ93191.1 polysaccharide deacetylase family protein [Falsibacillus albus]
MKWIFFLLVLFLVLTVCSTMIIRMFSIGIIKQGKLRNAIALTFDDGPDPLYTPKLLEVLKKHGAKATFFVVGKKAATYPELIQLIHREGHVVGIHNYIHFPNWLIPPNVLKKHLNKSKIIIKDILGADPIYYRPPWGMFNAFTLMAAKGFQVIMWTSIPGDWKERLGSKELLKRLISARKEGAIITLHDSGTSFGADRDAPRNMIEALDQFLALDQSKQYSFVTVEQLLRSGEK